ncbi:tumor suppressor candidate 2-like [Xenia sp. Carnegie-2017]|uniref:tumor suppressor candidate 2-like n=1 Tax=Xenia sp. Carnegie-2017 TaxID=2897299 RepID=UPI001F047D1E|nr:tumor suppressor candidate 2-like [Xenia sp. Carnegie-2017]
MGSKVSGLFRKVWDVEDFEENDSSSPDNKINRLLKNCGGSIFILKRVSSMFFNEDGDLAHEFYEEVKSKKRKRSKMKKIDPSALKPQGQVDLTFPKINPNIPIILCEA